MKNAVVLLLILILSFAVVAQKKPAVRKRPATASKAAKAEPPKPLDEKEEYEKASNLEIAADRVAALNKFLSDFPNSENVPAAKELIASSRILIAEEKLNSGDPGGAVAIYKLVIDESPDPIPNDLFSDSIGKIPSNLYWHGARPAALELANSIEKKVAANAGQLVEIANFYISIENGAEALRVAQAAAAADPSSEPAYRTLGIAERVNFELEESGQAFAKALELDPTSLAAKRGLAETKRALGKSDEALGLYRELLEKNDGDLPARTGMILSLFDAGKRADAETELSKSIEQNPSNIILLAGAAYWYAAHGDGARAVELAQKAIDKEPRYIWSHIALGRGLMAQKKPVEAEQALIKARQYGNFPTLEYEIASARTQAGFYRDAVEGLKKSFTVADGKVETKLGGRIKRGEATFSDLLAYERRASIFAPVAADDADTAAQLRLLLDLDEKLAAPEVDETAVAVDADDFTKGSDKMKVHRQLYAAALLLQKKVALPKVLELTKAATIDQDAGLDVANTGAAVMASELYDARSVAFSRNEFLLVPDVPRQTLSAILRGRIEELAGWALFNQGSYPEAVVRLRRSISVLPDKSAWWRSSMWRLGAALEADGKEKDALDAYVQSYKTDKPDLAKFIVVESLYKKINGNTEGLESAIGTNRMMATTTASPSEVTASTASPVGSTAAAEPTPEPVVTQPAEPAKSEVTIPKGVPVDTGKPVVQVEAAKVEPESPKPQVEPSTVPVETPKADPVEKKTNEPSLETAAQPEPVRPPMTEPTPSASPAEVPTEDAAAKETVKETEPKSPAPAETPAADQNPTKIQTPTEGKLTDPAAGTGTKPAEQPNPQPVVTGPPKTAPDKTETAEPAKTDPAIEKPTDNPEPPKTVEKPPAGTDKSPAKPPGAPATSPSGTTVAETEHRPKLVVVTDELPPPVDLSKKPKSAAAKRTATKPVDADESLFKPVIITIPRNSDNSNEAVTDQPKPKDTALASGTGRRRIIEGVEIKGDPLPTCSINSSENSLSVINDGGSVGIIVGVEGDGDIKDLKAVSSSPADVQVTLEPEIAGLSGRRFYVIKSISRSLGVFQIKFDAKCGRKEILVSVR